MGDSLTWWASSDVDPVLAFSESGVPSSPSPPLVSVEGAGSSISAAFQAFVIEQGEPVVAPPLSPHAPIEEVDAPLSATREGRRSSATSPSKQGRGASLPRSTTPSPLAPLHPRYWRALGGGLHVAAPLVDLPPPPRVEGCSGATVGEVLSLPPPAHPVPTVAALASGADALVALGYDPLFLFVRAAWGVGRGCAMREASGENTP